MSIGEIDNVNFGLRRGMLMNEPTYPFALRQDKKTFDKKSEICDNLDVWRRF